MEHVISVGEFNSDLIEDDLYEEDDQSELKLKPEFAEQFLKILNHRGAKPVRGDTVLIEQFSGYRNDGRLIFDGEKIIALEYEPDDYGNVPKQFHVLEAPDWFTPEHFSKIEHNQIVWFHFNSEIKEKLLESIKYQSLTNPETGEVKFFCYSTISIPFKDQIRKLVVVYDYTDSLPYDQDNCLLNEETGEINSERWRDMVIESSKQKIRENDFEFQWNEDSTLESFFPESFILKYLIPDLLFCPVCHKKSSGGGGSSKEGIYYYCPNEHKFRLDSNFTMIESVK